MDYVQLGVDITYLPLGASSVLLGYLAIRHDSFFYLPDLFVLLLLALNRLVGHRPWWVLFFVGFFLVVLWRAIAVWDRESKTKTPEVPYTPSWLANTPNPHDKLQAMNTPRFVKPKGYHRPETVISRTGGLRQIQS